MDSFVIELKNEKLNSYNRISYLISGINFFFFLFYSFSVKSGYERIVWILLSLMIIVFSFGSSFIDRKNNKPKISITYCLLILMWIPVSIWLAIVHVILLVLDTIARRSLKVNFTIDKIEYPSFPKRNIKWDELANVILKDGLLTMDFKNNKLIQDEIKISKQVNETAFNRYCEHQLKS